MELGLRVRTRDRDRSTWSEKGTAGSAMPARVSWTKVETALEASTVSAPRSEAQLIGMSTCRSAYLVRVTVRVRVRVRVRVTSNAHALEDAGAARR